MGAVPEVLFCNYVFRAGAIDTMCVEFKACVRGRLAQSKAGLTPWRRKPQFPQLLKCID
jgi:hypothetical protein